MWLFLGRGEEAVGYSLYHRQSARGDVPQNLFLRPSHSWKFTVLQCCFDLAVKAGEREAFAPVLVETLLFPWSFFFLPIYVIIWMYWRPPREGKSHVLGGNRTTMSFKSLKEFGVSAERLGSICKRWMARVQRSVYTIDFTLVNGFCQSFVLTMLWKDFNCRVCAGLKSLVSQPSLFWSLASPILLELDPCGITLCMWSDASCLWRLFCFASFPVSSACTLIRKCLCAGFFCDWDRGAVVVGTLAGIDSLSLKLAWKENGTI